MHVRIVATQKQSVRNSLDHGIHLTKWKTYKSWQEHTSDLFCERICKSNCMVDGKYNCSIFLTVLPF